MSLVFIFIVRGLFRRVGYLFLFFTGFVFRTIEFFRGGGVGREAGVILVV